MGKRIAFLRTVSALDELKTRGHGMRVHKGCQRRTKSQGGERKHLCWFESQTRAAPPLALSAVCAA